MTDLPTVKDIPTLAGTRVLVRLGLNVTHNEENEIVDAFRVDEVLPTITYLRERGARVIIMGHIGREPDESLSSVAEYIRKTIPLTFIPDIFADDVSDRINAMRDGDVVLLENLRQWDGETKNDDVFAQHLSRLADVYVNDAFAAAHRPHASIVGVPQYLPSYLGLQFAEELAYLSKARDPKHPFLFLLGGAKGETKIPLIELFIDTADDIFVGGALANTFYKARGDEIGRSFTDFDDIDRITPLLDRDDIHLPEEVVVETAEGERVTKAASEVAPSEMIMDAAPEAVDALRPLAQKAAYILWNGPLGNYEEGYDEGTFALAQLIAECDGTTIIGGGDTATLISRHNMKDQFTFVSTGGGALLDFLADGELPAMTAVANAPSEARDMMSGRK